MPYFVKIMRTVVLMEKLTLVTDYSPSPFRLAIYFWRLRPGTFHVRWVPCQHGMARPQVAGGGGGLQTWRVAANVLTKQSRTAD
jgi:hypothetical protein